MPEFTIAFRTGWTPTSLLPLWTTMMGATESRKTASNHHHGQLRTPGFPPSFPCSSIAPNITCKPLTHYGGIHSPTTSFVVLLLLLLPVCLFSWPISLLGGVAHRCWCFCFSGQDFNVGYMLSQKVKDFVYMETLNTGHHHGNSGHMSRQPMAALRQYLYFDLDLKGWETALKQCCTYSLQN